MGKPLDEPPPKVSDVRVLLAAAYLIAQTDDPDERLDQVHRLAVALGLLAPPHDQHATRH